jgi:AcrR family transcriptional regulator
VTAPSKKTEKKDRRIQRTEAALTRAMIDLALEKGYAAITIRDLTERAGVGYATFFRHFPDKEALLLNVLEVFVSELMALFADGAAASAPGSGAVVFRYIQAHHELCRVLLNSPGSTALVRRIQDGIVAHTLAQQTPRPGSVVPPEVAAHHLVTASIALIQWWLEHDRPYAPERMGVIYEALVLGPTQAVAFEGGQSAGGSKQSAGGS